MAVLVALVALAALVGACGSADAPPAGGSGPTVDVYASLPLSGPEAPHGRAALLGMRLALREAGGVAGSFPVAFTALDDATAAGWDRARTAANATRAAGDEHAVLYLGDVDASATAISIPILNQVGIAQISPASTYAGLTTGGVGARASDPDGLYPQGRRTFVRIVASDVVQAAVLVRVLERDGCDRLALVGAPSAYAEALDRLVEAQARGTAVQVVDDVRVGAEARARDAAAARLRAAGPRCVLVTGDGVPAGARLLAAAGGALPRARLYAAAGVCDPLLAGAGTGALPADVRRRLRCTSPAVDVSAQPGGPAFAFSFSFAYGRPPADPYAAYGYEAMRLGLDSIAGRADDGDQPDAVIDALFRTRARRSVLGTYAITMSGDTTLRRYGLWALDRRGRPRFLRAVTAAPR